MNHDPLLQQALQDLTAIRRAVDAASGSTTGKRPRVVAHTHLLLQGIGLVLALGLLAFEFVSNQTMSWILSLSRKDQEIGLLGLGEVALCLPFLVGTIYFVAWRASKHNDRDLQEFLARNFAYLRNMSFLSDLFVKFAMLSLSVLSGHGEWVPALLTLFLGDYLLQGRFFTLPLAVAYLVGPLCFAGAGVLYLHSSTQLLWPLTIFALLSAMSMVSIYVGGRSQ
ncbi:MAG TPA: hypothetical protein VIH99_07620 [Bdellovibrionota bacterium]|jgi:hypothetical protein